jgi:hypothetical protein
MGCPQASENEQILTYLLLQYSSPENKFGLIMFRGSFLPFVKLNFL